MVQRRLLLQSKLETILGVRHVYFQPAPNILLEYPAIVYERDYAATAFADNSTYRDTKRYQVTVIDRDPDSAIPDKVKSLPLCRFARHFTADNLHHDVYNLYF